MSQSSFTRSLFASTCIAGAIFSAITLPFASLKSNVVNLEVQNKPIVTSELQYLAAPYLAVAGGVSVAVGVGVFGILGWRNSARKLSNTAATNADLSKTLAAHQAELERIKFSEARLRTQDLNQFLQSDPTWPAPTAPSHPLPSSKIQIVHDQPAIPMHQVAPPAPSPAKLAQAMKPSVVPTVIVPTMAAVESHSSTSSAATQEPLESLVSQIQQLSRQVEELRSHSATRMVA
jgi:cell division protein FtsB